MTYPDSSYASFESDANTPLTEVVDPAGNDIDDTYDALNRNTSRSITLADGSGGTTSETRTYDALARMLTNAWMGSATPSNPTSAQYTKKIDYNYDDDGNRTSLVVTPWQQSAGTTSYTTNSLYQYTNVGGTTHVSDSNGNLTDDGTLLFEYDYKNLSVYVRLKSNNNLVVTYKYDALGRRVEKDLGNNNTQRYIYSGVETIATYNAFDTWKHDFVYAQGIDSIVMLEQATVLDYDSDQNTTDVTRSYYHRSALGSVMELTDMLQATVVSYRYDPYGLVTITRGGETQTTDPLGQHWTFTGRFFDEETRLYYYRARYYDPGLGRFSQRDPLGRSVAPGLYEYVASRPVTLRDPGERQPTNPFAPPPLPGEENGQNVSETIKGRKAPSTEGHERIPAGQVPYGMHIDDAMNLHKKGELTEGGVCGGFTVRGTVGSGWWFAGGAGFAWVQYVLERVWWKEPGKVTEANPSSLVQRGYTNPINNKSYPNDKPQIDDGQTGNHTNDRSPYYPGQSGGSMADHSSTNEHLPGKDLVDIYGGSCIPQAPEGTSWLRYRQDFWTYKVPLSDLKIVGFYKWHRQLTVDLNAQHPAKVVTVEGPQPQWNAIP